MSIKRIFMIFCIIVIPCILNGLQIAYGENPSDKAETSPAAPDGVSAETPEGTSAKTSEGSGEAVSAEIMDEILTGVEKRYSGKGFIAYFTQKSTIKAMDITDTAEGKVFIKRPGMMRWEYEKPEKQIILTDGEQLWIFKPDDNQVMTGTSPAYFGDGKGASILSDIRLIREKFTVSAQTHRDSEYYKFILLPKVKKPDLASLHLFIAKKSNDIERIVTYNAYEDETLIEMTHLQFDQTIDDSVFSFQIPEGADVVQLEE
ncbi:MAG: outer membrane lipoprotein carrier protein LolA [Desulfococcaceae bacterium]